MKGQTLTSYFSRYMYVLQSLKAYLLGLAAGRKKKEVVACPNKSHHTTCLWAAVHSRVAPAKFSFRITCVVPQPKDR
jgi:hypothetical protein